MFDSVPASTRKRLEPISALSAAISSIRSSRRSGVTWSPKPWVAEWSVTAK